MNWNKWASNSANLVEADPVEIGLMPVRVDLVVVVPKVEVAEELPDEVGLPVPSSLSNGLCPLMPTKMENWIRLN